MKLSDADLLRLLPEHISGDPQFAAAGEAANPALAAISRAIPNLLIWARLGKADPARFLPPLRRLTEARPGLAELDVETLESLAWQFHVDFREAARTKEQLAGMVLNSIAWHRIKGTPASIYAALALCGFETAYDPLPPGTRQAAQRSEPDFTSGEATPSAAQDARPRGIYIEEHDPGSHWASYQLGFSEIAEIEELYRIVAICREMQPARCRLWRVYTADYDMRPGVWSGPLPRNRWSYAWWSNYSGTWFNDIPGYDQGIKVSFGLRRKFQSEPWEPLDFLAWVWGVQIRSFLVGRRRLVWSGAKWSGKFERRHGFFRRDLAAVHAAEKFLESDQWLDRPWPFEPWAKRVYWDRPLPDWSMPAQTIPKSQGVWSDPSDKANSTWSGLNCRWSAPYVYALDAPDHAWSRDKWSEKKRREKLVRLNELFMERLRVQVEKLEPRLEGRPLFAAEQRFYPSFGEAALDGKGMAAFFQLTANVCGERIGEELFWTDFDGWPETPWNGNETIGRAEKPFSMAWGVAASAARSEALASGKAPASAAGSLLATFGESASSGEAPAAAPATVNAALVNNFVDVAEPWPRDRCWKQCEWRGQYIFGLGAPQCGFAVATWIYN